MRTERSAPRSSVMERPSSDPMMMVKIAVSPMSTIVTACSFGVFGLFDDSTILIIWST